jgi:hypothetical protein
LERAQFVFFVTRWLKSRKWVERGGEAVMCSVRLGGCGILMMHDRTQVDSSPSSYGLRKIWIWYIAQWGRGSIIMCRMLEARRGRGDGRGCREVREFLVQVREDGDGRARRVGRGIDRGKIKI